MIDPVKNEIICKYIDMVSSSCYQLDLKEDEIDENAELETIRSKIRETLERTGNPEEMTLAFFVHRCNNRFAQWDTKLSNDVTAFFVFWFS